MNITELDKSWNVMRAIVRTNGILPKRIITRPNNLVEILGNEMNWSISDSQLYINLLILNRVISYDKIYVYLTEDGYRMFLDEGTPFLKINFVENLPLNIDTDTPETVFYKIWDIIGSGKGDNPYYVDGKTFFSTIKRFISGLPPTYSAYTSSLHNEGKSTSRFDWCKDLFCLIPKEELIKFLHALSDKINELNISRSNIDNEISELDTLIQDTNEDVVIEEMSTSIESTKSMEATKKPKIFISHNSEDKEYAKALVYLLIQLGINDQTDIFCSSLPGFGCRFGKSFIDEIKEQYENHNLIMIFIHSPRYYDSHVSLCEMGAAWILKNEHYSFLTNDCEFSMLDAVIPPTEIAFKAGQDNTYHLLNDFKELVEKTFGLDPKNFSRWETIKTDFIKAVEK